MPTEKQQSDEVVTEWREGLDRVVEVQRGPGEDVRSHLLPWSTPLPTAWHRSRSRCRRTSTRASSARATCGTTRALRSSSGCAAGGVRGAARTGGRADARWCLGAASLRA